MRLSADTLRQMPAQKVREALSNLTPRQLEDLKYDYHFLARDDQLPPEGNWGVWFLNCGRGFGKTWTGVQWCREQIKNGAMRGGAIMATNSDVERVAIHGESGFLNVCHKNDKTYSGVYLGYPTWSPTKRTLFWENGAKIEFYSSQEPERLRGPQFEFVWGDELASWANAQMTWDMAQFCLRLGQDPRTIITTTPKPTKLVRELLKDPKTHVTTGSTFDNSANLAPTYLEQVKRLYEGTRLGRQELYAEVMEEAEGALWTTDMLDAAAVKRQDVPDLARIVISIDPAVTANAESDMTGIVVAGRDINGKVYILGDYTDKLSPQGWASKAISLYHHFQADRIVAERNQGGDMVRRTIEVEDETVPIKLVRASRGKYARAEPVSALYERGLVKHVSDTEHPEANLAALETQMRTWEPLGSIGSPDRLDAMVWAVTELSLGGNVLPEMALSYRSAEELDLR